MEIQYPGAAAKLTGSKYPVRANPEAGRCG